MAQESEKSNRETKPDASPKPIRGVLEFLIKFVAQVSREMSNITTHSCDRTIIMLGVLNSPYTSCRTRPHTVCLAYPAIRYPQLMFPRDLCASASMSKNGYHVGT